MSVLVVFFELRDQIISADEIVSYLVVLIVLPLDHL